MHISPEQALKIVLSSARPLKPRRLPLAEALGCCLAQDIRSDRDQPPTDRSAMDGYAVLAGDLGKVPVRLRLVGEVAAGSPVRLRVRPGTCAAVLTGGSIPPGADAVVPIEQTSGWQAAGDDGEVVFHAPARPGQHIRRRAEEAKRGAVLLRRGTSLGAAQIGVCAMVGAGQVLVHPRAAVAVLCTGDEVVDASERAAAHQLRDSNGPALAAALAQEGFCRVDRFRVRDNLRAIAGRLRRALAAHDVVLVTGGVSVGRYDFVPDAVRQVGARIRFHGVRMKPGQPQLYATLPRNRHIFGLPGNPVAVLTGFHELVLPALRRLGGMAESACRPAMVLPLAAAVRSKGERTYFALARMVQTIQGPMAAPVQSAGSADIIAACGAGGVIVIPQGVTERAAGELVEFHSWT